jgi:hypothetical protein
MFRACIKHFVVNFAQMSEAIKYFYGYFDEQLKL